MPTRRSAHPPRHRRKQPGSDVEDGVVSVAKSDPVDVVKELRLFKALKTDEERAVALVRMAFDVDAATVMAFLKAMTTIADETWRSRTIFSALRQARSRFTRDLPEPAQDAVLDLIQGIANESSRAAVLRQLPFKDLPPGLRTRLEGVAATLVDPVIRLRTIVALEPEPSQARARALLEMAVGIDNEADRGEALAIVSRLDQPIGQEAFTAASAIADAGVAGRALATIARNFKDDDVRAEAQRQILALAPQIENPLRRFDVLASLTDLPAANRRDNEATLFELASALEDPMRRCRAMFETARYTEDEVARKNALLAGIAAAERVPDLQQRGSLLALLRLAGPWLDPAVRAEVRRAVDRIADPAIQDELRSTLSRIFVRDRTEAGPDTHVPPTPGQQSASAPARQAWTWDLFVSYATPDVDAARSIAFELRSRGLRVFLSADAIDAAPGSSGWIAALDQAISSTAAMLVLVTDASMASKWVAQEWLKYYRLMVDAATGSLFSVRLSGPPIADLPLTLKIFQVIETDGRIAPSHFTRILDLVQGRSAER